MILYNYSLLLKSMHGFIDLRKGIYIYIYMYMYILTSDEYIYLILRSIKPFIDRKEKATTNLFVFSIYFSVPISSLCKIWRMYVELSACKVFKTKNIFWLTMFPECIYSCCCTSSNRAIK